MAEDILKFPFPYKMFLITEIKHLEFCRWATDGKSFKIDLLAFERFLQRPESFFTFKNRDGLVKNLDDFQFKLLRTEKLDGETCLQYFHECFQKNRMNLLNHIHRFSFLSDTIDQIANYDNIDSEGDCVADDHKNSMELGDPCCKQFNSFTNVKKERFALHVIMGFETRQKQLAVVRKAQAIREAGYILALNTKERKVLQRATNAVNTIYEHPSPGNARSNLCTQLKLNEKRFAKFYDVFRPVYVEGQKVKIDMPPEQLLSSFEEPNIATRGGPDKKRPKQQLQPFINIESESD